VSGCLIYFLASCNGCGNKPIEPTNEPTVLTPDKLVFVWNEANNNRDTVTLKTLYDTSIHYYQRKFTINECINRKIEYFAKYPDFTQSIEGNIFVDTLPNGFVKISFTKTIFANNEEQQVPAYLILVRSKGVWKIRVESDLKTDKILSSGAQIPANAVEGDFNGDGIMDYMWLETIDKSEECKIRFSGPIPPIIISACLGGSPVNEKDLDGDGADEVGILPVGESSCWKGYFVYTFKDNQWTEALEPIDTHCIQWEKNIPPVVRDTIRKGYVSINYSELTDNGIEIKTKTVKLPHNPR
jgi:hypothetical protein